MANPLFNPSTFANPTQSLQQLTTVREKFLSIVINHGPKLVFGLIVFLIGLWLINQSKEWLKKILIRRGFNASLATYTINLVSAVLKIILTISFFSTIGVETTSFVAVLGAAGLAVGLALQGNLSNFAGGVVLLLFKPFRANDSIIFKDIEGKVREIQTFHTIIITPDGRKVILPNGELSNSIIQNITSENHRRADFVFYLSPHADIDAARTAIQEIISTDDRIEKNVRNIIAVAEINAQGVKLAVKLWSKPKNYLDVTLEYPEKIKKALDQAKIDWASSQMDIRVIQKD